MASDVDYLDQSYAEVAAGDDAQPGISDVRRTLYHYGYRRFLDEIMRSRAEQDAFISAFKVSLTLSVAPVLESQR